MEQQSIRRKLLGMGFDPSLKGFRYVEQAVALLRHRGELVPMCKELYPALEMANAVSNGTVERAMRHAIDKAWDSSVGNEERWACVGGMKPNKGKPTVGQTIAGIAFED